MKLAYLDSSICITMSEGLSMYQKVVRKEVKSLEEKGWTLCISDLVTLEVKIKPYRLDRLDLLFEYDLSYIPHIGGP